MPNPEKSEMRGGESGNQGVGSWGVREWEGEGSSVQAEENLGRILARGLEKKGGGRKLRR